MRSARIPLVLLSCLAISISWTFAVLADDPPPPKEAAASQTAPPEAASVNPPATDANPVAPRDPHADFRGSNPLLAWTDSNCSTCHEITVPAWQNTLAPRQVNFCLNCHKVSEPHHGISFHNQLNGASSNNPFGQQLNWQFNPHSGLVAQPGFLNYPLTSTIVPSPWFCARDQAQTQSITYLGVSTEALPESLRVHSKVRTGMGLLIETVEASSPAQAAGLERYDILEKLDDQWLANRDQLTVLVRSFPVGAQVQLTVVHAGESKTLQATLASRESPESSAASFAAALNAAPPSKGKFESWSSALERNADASYLNALHAIGTSPTAWSQTPTNAAPTNANEAASNSAPSAQPRAHLGLSVSPPSEALVQQLRLRPGMCLAVDSTEKGGPAASAGVQVFDILEKLDDQWLVNAEQLSALLRSRSPGEHVELTVIRAGERAKIPLTLGEAPVEPGANQSSLDVQNWNVASTAFDSMRLDNAVTATWLRDALVWPTKDGVSDDEFARRAYLDLLGNVASKEAIQDFVNDADANKRRKLIDTLLTNPEAIRRLNGVATLTWSDDAHQLAVSTSEDGSRRLLAKDSQGNAIFDGAIDTDEQIQALPASLLAKTMTMLRGFESARQAPTAAVSGEEQLNWVVANLDYDETPLADAFEALRRESGANFAIDWKELAAAKIEKATPVTLRLKNVKLGSALAILLELAGDKGAATGVTPRGEVILIGAGTNAQASGERR